MNEKAFLKLEEAFKQAEEVTVQGKTILKTPSIVKPTLKPSSFNKIVGFPLIQGSARWKPSLSTPRAEFISAVTENIESLGSNISYSKLDFPNFCCKCMEPVSHYELAELCSKEFGGKTRIWYAVPFCKEHNLESKAITIDIKGQAAKEKVVINFINKEYGRIFGMNNSLAGSWLTTRVLKTRALAPIAIFFGAALVLFGSLSLYDNLIGIGARIEKGLSTVTSFPVSISVFIIGLVLLVLFTSFWIKNKNGEKL